MSDLKVVEIEVHHRAVEDTRLDVYLVKRLHTYSRTLIAKLIKDGYVAVSGKRAKASYQIEVGDRIEVRLPRLIEPQMIPEKIPLDIVHEDEHMVVVNKPPHFVVHPAAGHWDGTLANALLAHVGHDLPQSDDDIYRPGIVHRLDQDTSGVIVCAKTATAHAFLSKQFQERLLQKEYLAIVEGEPRLDGDWIDAPIGRHPREREKMAVRKDGDAKEAQTRWEVLERWRGFALVKCYPKTGRTHQIRVHLAHIGHPIVADESYGRRETLYEWELEHAAKPEGLGPQEPILARHALHAFALQVMHPATGVEMRFEAPMAADMALVVETLRKHRARS
ncbi:MAG: RluA family pseudouridine synthase [Planctomycetes bacterium]|nr:RluA family pseudouridine synthase [Planctomycetota bacterium]